MPGLRNHRYELTSNVLGAYPRLNLLYHLVCGRRRWIGRVDIDEHHRLATGFLAEALGIAETDLRGGLRSSKTPASSTRISENTLKAADEVLTDSTPLGR